MPYFEFKKIVAALIAVSAFAFISSARADNVDGAWSNVNPWPLIGLHAVITPDGRVLSYGTKGDGTQTGFFIYDVWDPSAGLTGGHITLQNFTATDIFCSSQIILPQSGDIIIAGGDNWTGTSTTNSGNNKSNIFDYTDDSLTTGSSMNRARWYSSSTALVNGEIYIQGGSGGADRPEVRETTGGFRLLTGAITSPYSTLFPRNFLAPDGRVFGYDTNGNMYFVDASGLGSLVSAGQFSSSYAGWQSSAAMFRPGRILQMAANSNGALVIDINGPQPSVTPTASMSSQRRWVSATVLPDGRVLATNGSRLDNQLVDVNTSAEIWDPDTGQWHVGPQLHVVSEVPVARLYHSSALLLPDASVLVMGGGAPGPLNNTNAEIYYPPYLYASGGGLATRPQIISAPDTANVGDALAVQVDSSTISRVTLVKTGSVTHSVNMDQRFLELPFIQNSNMLDVSLPVRASDTPPGFYHMFAINDSGVPSVAHMLRINIDPTPNTAVDYTPAMGGSGGSPFQLACNVDEVLVGVHGKYGTVINQIGPQCVQMDQFGHWIGSPVDGPVTGTTSTGTSFTKTCPPNFAMSGLQGRAGSSVDQLAIECRALTPTGGLTGPGQFLSPDGGSGGSAQGPYACGTDNPVYALYGNSSTQINRLGVQCRQAVVTPISVNSDPVIVNPGTQGGVIGVPVNLQINASDGDSDPLTFCTAGPSCLLPPGLNIDTDGLITGIPTTVGTFNAVVTVTDGVTIDTANFDWIIDLTPPLIVEPMPAQPPQAVDTPITYTASASGGTNVMYKWDFGDGTAETPYSSSPSITHTFTNPVPGPGVYYIQLTVKDDAGELPPQTFVQGVHLPLTANKPSTSTNITYEIRTSPDNSRVWAVNQDNDSVTVFDAVTHANMSNGEITVGVAPRSVAIAPDGRVWVTNKTSASISIIDPDTLLVVQTITMPFASQPYGIVFSPVANEAFVTLQATGTLLKLDASTGVQVSVPYSSLLLGTVDTGPNPRGVAINATGTSVFVSRFITPPQLGEDTAVVESQEGGQNTGGELLVVDSTTMTFNPATDTIILQHSTEPDAENQGRGVPNYLGALAISPDGTSGRVPSKKDNIMRGILRNPPFNLNFQNTVRAISSSINLTTNTENYSKRIDYDNSSISSAALFDPYGIYAFVAQETSQEIAVIDAYADMEIFRINVGRAPQGVTISPDGMRLYVNNFMDRTVDVLDLNALQTSGQWSVGTLSILPSVSTEKLSPQVLLGKQLFYDALDTRLAFDRYLSCAACHNDGDGDGRVWDLTGMGEGLRNTYSLTGHDTNQGREHRTGNFDEIQDFESQIRALSKGSGFIDDADLDPLLCGCTRNEPLGDPKAGFSADLDALAAYVESLVDYPDSPYRNGDGTMTADGIAGRQIFVAERCFECHSGSAFTDSNSDLLHDIGTIKGSSGSRLGQPLIDPNTGLPDPDLGLDTPTLRGVWSTAPYLHDGSAATIADAMLAHNGVSLVEPELSQLVAYLQQIDGLEPCTVCVDFAAVTTSSFAGADYDSDVTILNGGASIRLDNNTWRQTVATYTITPNTIVEFTFESTVQGEIHGLGFDNDNVLTSDRIFRVYGTQNWGIPDFDTYSGSGQQFFTIPVGQYFTGSGFHLILVNDDDAGVGANGIFSGIRVYENVVSAVPPVIDNPGNQSDRKDTNVSLTVTASDANGDTLTFAATGLPDGLSIAPNGTISGIPTTAATYDPVTVTVDDGNGGLESAVFTWTITDPPACTDCIDFSTVTTSSYSNGDYDKAVTVLNNGASIRLDDNTWRQTDSTYTITPDTVLEFTFESTVQGEIQGIGFDENSSLSVDRIFRLYGTQNWGIADFNTYSGSGQQVFTIPVGQYFTGSGFRLILVDDDDAGVGANGTFTDVRVYENVQGPVPPVINNPGNQNNRLNSNVLIVVTATDANGDTLTFSATGLPDGLGIAPDGTISGIPTTLAVYDPVTVTVNDGNGGIDSAVFTWTITDELCADCVDFAAVPTSSFAGADYDRDVTILNGGASIRLDNNTWRQTDTVYTLTPNTVLEFTFESSVQGEIQGIGFDEDSALSATRIFRLYGTQNWGIADFNTYSGSGQQLFSIPIGQYYSGVGFRLILVDDDDAGVGANGTFTDVRIYESQ